MIKGSIKESSKITPSFPYIIKHKDLNLMYIRITSSQAIAITSEGDMKAEVYLFTDNNFSSSSWNIFEGELTLSNKR